MYFILNDFQTNLIGFAMETTSFDYLSLLARKIGNCRISKVVESKEQADKQ